MSYFVSVREPCIVLSEDYHTKNISEAPLENGNLWLHRLEPGVGRSQRFAKTCFLSLPTILGGPIRAHNSNTARVTKLAKPKTLKHVDSISMGISWGGKLQFAYFV